MSEVCKYRKMIQAQTSLNVADNSGAKKVMCIQVLGGQRTIAKIGDLVIGVVKEAESKKNPFLDLMIKPGWSYLS